MPTLVGAEDTGAEQIVIYDEYGATRMIRTPEWKYICRDPAGPNELYNLVEDPGERENCSGDPAHRLQINTLHTQLIKWFHRYSIPELDGLQLGVRGLGQLRQLNKSNHRDRPVFQQHTGNVEGSGRHDNF